MSGDSLSSTVVEGESEVRIKINWAGDTDLQYDPNVDWYTDGVYQLEWILTNTSDGSIETLTKFMDGVSGTGFNVFWTYNDIMQDMQLVVVVHQELLKYPC